MGGFFDSKKAISRILKIKKRKNDKFTIIASGLNQVRKYFKLNPVQVKLAKKYWPGPFSLVVSPKFAVRVPDNSIARKLARSAGRPLIATSANLSGQTALYSGQEVIKTVVSSDGSGKWETSFKELPIGQYSLRVTARDERGAVSYPLEIKKFRVLPPIVLSVGPLDLGWSEIFIIVMLLVVAGLSLFARQYASKKKTREAYRVIVGQDIEKLSVLLSDDLEELEETQKLDDSSRLAQAKERIDKMRKTIIKMKKYIGEEVNKMK